MKKFFLKMLAFALAAIVPLAAYFAFEQSKPSVYIGSLMGCLQYKVRTLRDTPGARVLLVGGSGLPYSVNCDAVSTAFGRPCLNLGGTAYVGMEFYLSMVKPYIHEGDIIVLAPEFCMYEDVYSYTTVWMTVENDDLLLKAIPVSYLPGMVANYANYVKYRNSVLKTHGPPEGDMEAQYRSFQFGPFGDLTFTRTSELTAEQSLADTVVLGADTAQPRVLRAMNSFYEYATQKGATVVLTYSPFCEEAVSTGAAGADAFEMALREKCDIPLISRLEDLILPREFFYNTNNHLTSEGMAWRTAALIADLQAAGAGRPA